MQSSGGRRRLVGVEDLAGHGGEVDGLLVVETSLAAGQGEEGVDQPLLFPARFEDLLAGGAQRVEGDVRVGERDLEHGPIHGQGGAQLVGGVGDEATLRVERPFQPSEEPVDGVAQLGELVSGPGQGQTLMEVVLGDVPGGVGDGP